MSAAIPTGPEETAITLHDIVHRIALDILDTPGVAGDDIDWGLRPTGEAYLALGRERIVLDTDHDPVSRELTGWTWTTWQRDPLTGWWDDITTDGSGGPDPSPARAAVEAFAAAALARVGETLGAPRQAVAEAIADLPAEEI